MSQADYSLTEIDTDTIEISSSVFGVKSTYRIPAAELESNLGGAYTLGGFVPPGAFWFSPGNSICLYHEPSSQKTFWLRRGELGEGEGSIDDYKHKNWMAISLWLPGLCYLLNLDPYWPRVQAVWLVYSEVPPDTGGDWSLSYLPIPNISAETGAVCGSDYIAPPRRPESISEAIAYALDSFWHSAFNYDRDDFKNSAFMKQLKILRRQQELETVWEVWEGLDLANSSSLLQRHCPAQNTLQEVINEQLAAFSSSEALGYRFLTQLFPPRYES